MPRPKPCKQCTRCLQNKKCLTPLVPAVVFVNPVYQADVTEESQRVRQKVQRFEPSVAVDASRHAEYRQEQSMPAPPVRGPADKSDIRSFFGGGKPGKGKAKVKPLQGPQMVRKNHLEKIKNTFTSMLY